MTRKYIQITLLTPALFFLILNNAVCHEVDRDVIAFSKSNFYSGDMAKIINIAEIDSDICIFDYRGMYVVEKESRNLKNVVLFKDGSLCSLKKPIVYGKENVPPILLVRGTDFNVGVKNFSGDDIWMFSPKIDSTIYSMVSGDINNDGESEYYVATDQGLYSLNSEGKVFWKKMGMVYDVAISEKTDAMKSNIVTISSENSIQYRNYEGVIVNETKPDVKMYSIQITDWPKQNYFLTSSKNTIYILDNKGNIYLSYELDNFIFGLKGVSFLSRKKDSHIFAVLSSFRADLGQTMLCIFSDQKLIYKELLKATNGLTAAKDSNSGEYFLIVGDGPGKTVKYSQR